MMQINRMKFTKMEMRMGPFMIHHSEELMMVSQHPKSSKWILTIVHIMMNTLGTPPEVLPLREEGDGQQGV